MTRLGRAVCSALMPALAATHAYAQPGPVGRRIEVSAGIVWLGRASFGRRDANETTGTGGTFRLFSTTSELGPASGLTARVTMPLVRRIEVEAAGSYVRPDLTTYITADVETSNAPIAAVAHFRQFTVGGAALWYPVRAWTGSRGALFLRAGAALERRLEDNGTRIVDGPAIEAGGGVKYLLASRSRGWWRGVGARGDIVARVRGGALAVDGRTHVSPALAASVYVRF